MSDVKVQITELVERETTQSERLQAEFGCSGAEFRAAMLPLFALMHAKGMNKVVITRDGTNCNTNIS